MLLFSLCTSFFSSALNLVCPASLFFFFLCLSHLRTHHAVTHSHFITAACRPSRSEAPGCQCFSFESANGATRGPRAAHRLTALTDTHTHTDHLQPLRYPFCTNIHLHHLLSPFLFALLLFSPLYPSCLASVGACSLLLFPIFPVFIFSFSSTFSPSHFLSLSLSFPFQCAFCRSTIFLPKHVIKENTHHSQCEMEQLSLSQFLFPIQTLLALANREQ